MFLQQQPGRLVGGLDLDRAPERLARLGRLGQFQVEAPQLEPIPGDVALKVGGPLDVLDGLGVLALFLVGPGEEGLDLGAVTDVPCACQVLACLGVLLLLE